MRKRSFERLSGVGVEHQRLSFGEDVDHFMRPSVQASWCGFTEFCWSDPNSTGRRSSEWGVNTSGVTDGRGANAPLAAQMWAFFWNWTPLRLPVLPKQFYKL